LAGPERPLFKVGVLTSQLAAERDSFLHERYVDFVPVTDRGGRHPQGRSDISSTCCSIRAAAITIG
jgi:hypothetical protein